MGLVYPSFESRAEIEKLVAARDAEGGWPRDPDGAPLYPGAGKSLSSNERKERMMAGEPYALRLNMTCGARACRRFKLARRRGGFDPRRSRGLGRCRARAQGLTDELSSLRRGRRCAAGRDTCRARARSVSVHQRAPVVAGIAWASGAILPPPPADSRFGRAQAFQIQSVDGDPRIARGRRNAFRYQANDGSR